MPLASKVEKDMACGQAWVIDHHVLGFILLPETPLHAGCQSQRMLVDIAVISKAETWMHLITTQSAIELLRVGDVLGIRNEQIRCILLSRLNSFTGDAWSTAACSLPINIRSHNFISNRRGHAAQTEQVCSLIHLIR
jgi:hypothetical protein